MTYDWKLNEGCNHFTLNRHERETNSDLFVELNANEYCNLKGLEERKDNYKTHAYEHECEKIFKDKLDKMAGTKNKDDYPQQMIDIFKFMCHDEKIMFAELNFDYSGEYRIRFDRRDSGSGDVHNYATNYNYAK